MHRKLILGLAVLASMTVALGVPAASAGGSTPGVTKDEIKVGVTYIDFSSIRDIVDIDHGDYEAAYRAVIEDVNTSGGIDGRKIAPVFAAVSPVGTVAEQEACVKLTEDEKVFAAIGILQRRRAALLRRAARHSGRRRQHHPGVPGARKGAVVLARER